MALCRRWWEAKAQEEPHDRSRGQPKFDLADLMSLVACGREVNSAQLAAVLCCAERDRNSFMIHPARTR